MYLPKWEKIVPFLVIFIFVAATPPASKKIYRKNISTIVIDAGHGGHDPGCMTNNVREKDVTLAIALALGSKLKDQLPDVKIIYTRSGDKFVELWERAAIANRNNADLFISIHCNASKNTSINGTETFAMGLHKADENLEVAKRENDVVLLEDDYMQRYEGFDPSSPESHIYFSLFQNAYMDQSIKLAARVENQISTGIKRPSRGVKQAGFVVLWKTKMPSILIETGFISNKKDREFLNSETGVENISSAMANAIGEYKKSFEAVSSSKIN
ncbi:MAG: N-acetylmuramoyl-L-alanine amidase [Bacteroidetes bacterium B1(2017)]|nr:MAG: N-acetylmuramoyl-L-alanine amidase [Bacteroidetes bacterium B1(2017)]